MVLIPNTLTIARKELKSYFDSLTAYVVLIVFLSLWEYLFFRNAFLVGEASLRILFDFLPWLLLIVVPAITMGTIAQEKSKKTLELLLTHPVKESEVLLGKFLASTAFVTIAILLTLPIAVSFNIFGNLDWGVVLSQYLAALGTTSLLVALGIFVSSLLGSQISALLVAAGLSFFLTIIGLEFVTVSLPLRLAPLLENLSILSRFNSMTRGVLDLRDIWYFFSLTAIFLSLAYLQLLRRKFGKQRSLYHRYQAGMTLFTGIAVLTNIISSRIPGRVDLTQNRQYSLSESTHELVSALSDVVNITLFASKDLPTQFQPLLRDTKDMLRDYQTMGKGNILISYKDPSSNPQVAQEASSLGIREAQFNVIGREELQIKTGYLGLVVSFGDNQEVTPFIQDTGTLEYQLTSAIYKLTATDKKAVGFLSGHGEKGLSGDYQTLNEALEKQFEVTTVQLDEANPSLPEDLAVLVVAGPNQAIDDQTRETIKEFLNRGGAGLFLIDAITVNSQLGSAQLNQESFVDFLETYGVTVQPNIVYDIRSNETIRFSGGPFGLFVSYPMWPRARIADQALHLATKIEGVVLPWPSPVSLDEGKTKENAIKSETILTTTESGGIQSDILSISPQQELSSENLGQQTLGVKLESGAEDQSTHPVRMAVIGDSDFLGSQFLNNIPENTAFGVELISWLAQEESLASIQLKQRILARLIFEDNNQVSLVKYGNLALALFLPALFGSMRIVRRRNLKNLSYQDRP